MDIDGVIGDYSRFIQNLLEWLEVANVNVQQYQIDHLCYRTGSVNEYTKIKQKMMQFSSAYLENTHHGRPVAKYLLRTPLRVLDYTVSIIEVPAPKSNIIFPSGLEHFEMAVGNDFENFKNKYKSLWTGIDDSGQYNQPVYISFSNGKTVKFHQYSLFEVLQKEGQEFTQL